MAMRDIKDPLSSLGWWAAQKGSEGCIIQGDTRLSYLKLCDYLSAADRRLERYSQFDTAVVAFNDQLKALVYGIACLGRGINIYLPGSSDLGVALKQLLLHGRKVILLHDRADLETSIPNIYVKELSLESNSLLFDFESFCLKSGVYLSGSGTTSESQKLIYHRPDDLKSMIRRDCIARSFSEDELHVCLISVRFFTGFRRSLAALSAGGCVVLPGQGSSSQELVERINSLRIDHLSCVTSQINVLFQKSHPDQVRFPNLKSLLVSGSPVYGILRAKIKRYLTPYLFVGYGTNEIGEVSIYSSHLSHSADKNSVGFLLDGISAEVRSDENGFEKLFLRDAYGSGYYGNLDTWSDFFSPNDIAHLGSDGELFILGRSDDVIFFEGINIHSVDIENKISIIPSVTEVAAFGDVRQHRLGAPVVFIELNSHVAYSSINQSLHKIFPRMDNVEVWAGRILPKTPNGKILKRSLKDFLRFGKSPGSGSSDFFLVGEPNPDARK
jgi:non-ribosomal peptide synthetase component E (peptide arylation enzyme)